ncbi:MAG: PQQ-dependent sugar dehydrogenase, partial [Gammaproteobacteria bacterium]|nr:PQQ-dependent sugar dehydrogenase [Gammaproteobacteria bacterium]
MKFKNPLCLLGITLFIQLLFFSVADADFMEPFTIKSEGIELRVEQVADNFSVPWSMAFISKEKMLITERDGSVYLFNLTDAKKRKLSNTPSVLATGQGGMLDVILSPDFPKTGWIYFTYVKAIDGKGATTLGRGRLNDEQSGFSEWQELLVTKSTSGTSRHFGSRIAFDDKGHLFFGIGDRGERDYAQDLSNHAGAILRLNLDGSVPD